MDERRLGALFRDAAGDPPPATFGLADVVAASHRATVRRRNALAAGTLLGVAILAGGLTIGSHVMQDRNSTAGRQADAPAAEPGPRTLGAPPGAAVSAESGQTRCGPLDGELAAHLNTVLVARGAAIGGPPSEVPGPCSDGSRAAAVPVTGGTFYLLVAPPGRPLDVPRPDGARGHELTSGGGRKLVVISTPLLPGRQAPLADQLPDLARELADLL